MEQELIVIGGGAAGLFAAIHSARAGVQVLLLEKNPRPGRKLAITGKGRCNVTNNCSPEQVLRQVPRNAKFLYSSVWGFPPERTMAFFEAEGCPLKTERGGRVFPVSDRAFDIVDALERAAHRAGVRIAHETAQALLLADGCCRGVVTDRGERPAQAVLVATGGCSYPLTGSTGDGYRLAQQAGHTVVPPRGSLVPLVEDGDWCAQMQGLSLRNVELRLKNAKGKEVFSEFGELLFTHFGLSGPIVLSASAHMKPGERYRVILDLKPALDEQRLDARLLRDFEKYQNRNFENALGDLLAAKMIPVVIARSGIDPAQKVNSITKPQRRRLLEQIKAFSIDIQGLRPVEEAIVTAGGVRTAELQPATMASKKMPGLFFAGEVIDCDAYTGGYNLQIAWSTAYAAAQGVAQMHGKDIPE